MSRGQLANLAIAKAVRATKMIDTIQPVSTPRRDSGLLELRHIASVSQSFPVKWHCLMADDNSKADRKSRRKLGSIAWDRELRAEIHKLSEAIGAMDADDLTPHEVNDQIHDFHNGITRELWGRYTQSDPGAAVYRASCDGYLTDDDLAIATDGVRESVRLFVELMDEANAREGMPETQDDG